MFGGLARIGLALTLALVVAGCAASPTLQGAGVLSAGSTTSSATQHGKAKPFNPFADHVETDVGRRQVIENPTVADVMKPGPLPEMSLGRANAPVTIIKYASLTCPFCSKFQTETFPVLKRDYIDTGKVRYILREFPIGFQSGTATIAWRCAPANKYFELYDKFMRQQRQWVSQTVRREPIFKIARQVGMTRAQFDACYADKSLSEKLNAVKERGRTLGIIGTPNFFINGKLYKRRLGTSDIHSLVAQALAKPVAAANN